MLKEVYCTPEFFAAPKDNPGFHQLLGLARITNTIRFAHGAVVRVEQETSPADERQRLSSFLYLAALLFEALKLSRTVGKHFQDFSSFRNGFAKLHSDPDVEELRTNVLDRIRNTAVFHLDQGVIPTGLELLQPLTEFVFLSARDLSNGEIYYRLADQAVVHYIVGDSADTPEFTEKFKSILQRTTDLSIRFSACADELITEYLISHSWSVRQ